MNAQAASELGKRIAALIQAGRSDDAYALLAPVLAERTRFPLLERIGEPIGAGPLPAVNAFLEQVAATKTEGGWVVIGRALGQQLRRDAPGAFARCRAFVIGADVWYATDILGERVPGLALVTDFQTGLSLLTSWREDSSAWVRRTTGVAVHLWAKRSRGAAEYVGRAKELVAFLDPMFEERDINAIKGIGWGLKTLGRYYPDLVTDWLGEQIVHRQRRCRALMLEKALTYLSEDRRTRATGGFF
jgi:hypothetical protein